MRDNQRDQSQRDKPWIFRTYAGHSTARDSNELYRKNLAKGQTGLSVAFDLPTQTGYDSDHVLARGEVGKVGVPVNHLGDMRALFDGIPLGTMNTSMTINATAAWLMALYIAVADEQGAPRAALTGTIQNDIIKEYLSRGTYVFPPAPSMRLIKDVAIFTTTELPKWNPMNICSYHLQEAGATPVQELAFALATAIAVLDTVKASGEVTQEKFGEVVGRISFFVNAGLRFVTEICKMRAFVELWDEITRERYGITDPKQRLFRYGVQVNSLGLTEPQPENNVTRIMIEMLAVTLSKNARARAVQLPAWNEALGLPRPWDQQWSLRMQQILAYETDLLEYGDLFDGSPVMARKVEELKREAKDELKRIEEMGGAVAAVETGYMKRALVDSNTARLEAIERGDQVVVGVNKYLESEPSPLTGGVETIMTVSEEAEVDQLERLKAWRAARDAGAVAAALQRPQARRGRRRQHHAGLDRLRQSRRHHRRMGLDLARSLRRIPRADRRRPGDAQRRRRPRRHSRRRRSRFAQARPANDVPGRQARPRRPFQRRRADRGARARRRHAGGLSGHPADARGDRRCRARAEGACGRAVDPFGQPSAAGQGRDEPLEGGRHRRRAGRGRRHHPAGGRRKARTGRGRSGLHAEGFRAQPHHVRSGADRRNPGRRAADSAAAIGLRSIHTQAGGCSLPRRGETSWHSKQFSSFCLSARSPAGSPA